MDPGSSPFRESCAELDAVSTPAGIKLAWRHAIHEQKLINRILKLSQLSKVKNREKWELLVFGLIFAQFSLLVFLPSKFCIVTRGIVYTV